MDSEEKETKVSGHQTSRKYYAHSLPGRPKEEWQLLEDHLKNVAEIARGFAEDFEAGKWAGIKLQRKEVL